MVHPAGDQQPAVWQLLDDWGTEGSCWGGPLLQALQQYCKPAWRAAGDGEGELRGLDEGQALIQELHWEIEAKLMNMLAFITSRECLAACLAPACTRIHPVAQS